MLDINTAKVVKDGIEKILNINVSLYDVCRMQLIPNGAFTREVNILALHCTDTLRGDKPVTILVRTGINYDDTNFKVIDAKAVFL